MTTSTAELVAYSERRESAARSFAKLPRGSQSRASFDVRFSATRVSRVLKGTEIDERVLEALELWLKANEQAA